MKDLSSVKEASKSSVTALSATPETSSSSDTVVTEEIYIYVDPPSILGFNYPCTVEWFFSVVGCEYCHTYFWICKDLAWTQDWKFFSLWFGLLALFWWSVIAFHVIRTRSIDEAFNAVGLFLWLFANFWWMSGEVYDILYPDEPSVSQLRTDQSARVLETALCILLFYYLILIPFNIIPYNKKALDEYDDGSMKPRFSYFKTFRQYESVHMLFWLSKDLAWNRNNISLWFLMLIPTFGLALDYFSMSLNVEDATVDVIHYAAQLLWVLGNTVWALGEFFFSEYDEALGIWSHNSDSFHTARWYSSWILLLAFVPIMMMYSIWFPLTCSGKLNKRLMKKVKRNKSAGDTYGSSSSSALQSDSKQSNSNLNTHTIKVVNSTRNSGSHSKKKAGAVRDANSRGVPHGTISGVVLGFNKSAEVDEESQGLLDFSCMDVDDEKKYSNEDDGSVEPSYVSISLTSSLAPSNYSMGKLTERGRKPRSDMESGPAESSTHEAREEGHISADERDQCTEQESLSLL